MRRSKTLLVLSLSAALLSCSGPAGRTRRVPDTLDLRRHALASIHYLTHQPDAAQGMLPYFWTFYDDNPAELRHNHWDYCENPGRFLYGLIAARQVTGSLDGVEAERAFEKLIYKTMIGSDGLCYKPAYSPFERMPGEPRMNLWDNRSDFMGLLSLYMLYGEPEVRDRLERMIDGLEKLAVRDGKYAYFQARDYPLGRPVDSGRPPRPPRVSQDSGGWITPLIQYHQVTGSRRALELAVALADFVVDFHQASLRSGATLGISNVHGALFTVSGVIRAALVTGDREHLAWAEKLVDFAARDLASDFGWVQEMERREWMTPEQSNSCEFCAVVDLVQASLLLAGAGYPGYWDRVERYVRNYYVEGQILDTGWMKSSVQRADNVNSSFRDVPGRVRGCFVGWGDPNDLVDPTARVPAAIQNCCGPHGAWGLFLIWHRIVAADGDGVRVNLSLNRETPWCRVDSYRPYQGRVDVHMRVARPLGIRIPDWVDRSRVRCLVDGLPVETAWDGGYCRFAAMDAGQTASVQYPLRREIGREVIDGVEYVTEWKGDTVIRIDPPGKVAPLFRRDRFRRDRAPMKAEPDPVFRPEIDRAFHEIDW